MIEEFELAPRLVLIKKTAKTGMTKGPLETVQANSGSVSIQIQAGPGQILSAKILTQASFCQTFARPLFGIYWL